MGNNSFCEPSHDFENQNTSNLPSLRNKYRERAMIEIPEKKIAKNDEKKIQHIEQDIYQITYADGAVYRGTINGDKRHGKGRTIHSDGTCYDGEWHQDEAKGRGTLKARRFVFEGEFDKNQPIKGKVKIHKKRFCEEYEGELKDFCYHGKGKLIVEGYSKYEGQFQNGKKHGKGSLLFDSGYSYSGQFQYDSIEGQGIYKTHEYRYEGQFKNNKFQGKGQCLWVNGSSYQGDFFNGKRQGFGTYFSPSGKKLTCEWRRDKPLKITKKKQENQNDISALLK